MKKELSEQERHVVEAIRQSLKPNEKLKSTTPVRKHVDGQIRYTMWVEKENKERFLVFPKNNGELKYLSEEYVNQLRKNGVLTTKK